MTTENPTSDYMMRARRAQKEWRLQTIEMRLQYIRRLRKQLVHDLDEWVSLFADETRKTPTDTITSEIFLVASACRYYEKRAAEMLHTRKMVTPLEFFGQRSYIMYEPLGVVAIISPWNFPLQLSLIPLISALIAGNAVILKPSEHTPRINEKIADTVIRCGFPTDLVQVLVGAGDVGAQLIESKPDKVFFTGGSTVGRKVYEQAGRLMIPCDLELGGNDALIVCSDANLERAARAAVWGGFFHSGQVCVGVERVYVVESLYERFVERVLDLTKALRQGVQADDDLGGMTTKQGFMRVQHMVAEAVQAGAKIRIGGMDEATEESLYYPPTVLTNVDDEMPIVKEETFGPVLCIMPVKNEAEAIDRTNRSPYGLNSYVFSRDLNKAMRIAAALETGNCYINDVITNISNMNLPFGGVKASGLGRYHGAEGLYTFSNIKSVMVDRGRKNNKFTWFPYSGQRLQWLAKALRWLHRG
jgi:acyl-CoA reductase-like NAD-dependent aldehyde dehydrogenase